MGDGKISVLFVCEDNSIRSVIAHALMNRFAGGRFRVFSCGHRPAREIHPRAIEMLSHNGLNQHNRRPRGLNDFLCDGAPEMDLVINLCDEALPAMPGAPMTAKWRITHPVLEATDAGNELVAFQRTFRELENRIRLIALLRYESREARARADASLPQAA